MQLPSDIFSKLVLLTAVSLIHNLDELLTPAGRNPHLTLVLVSDAIRSADRGAHLWGTVNKSVSDADRSKDRGALLWGIVNKCK
jgi:hypothetical protein